MIQNSSGNAPVTGSAASNNTDVTPHVTDVPQTRTRETR